MRINKRLVIESKPLRLRIPSAIFPRMHKYGRRFFLTLAGFIGLGETLMYGGTHHWLVDVFWMANAWSLEVVLLVLAIAFLIAWGES